MKTSLKLDSSNNIEVIREKDRIKLKLICNIENRNNLREINKYNLFYAFLLDKNIRHHIDTLNLDDTKLDINTRFRFYDHIDSFEYQYEVFMLFDVLPKYTYATLKEYNVEKLNKEIKKYKLLGYKLYGMRYLAHDGRLPVHMQMMQKEIK